MKKFPSPHTTWDNRHETFTENINVLYTVQNEQNLSGLEGYNDTTKGLQLIIREAIQKGLPLRSLGAGWSWTKVATAQNGIMIDTKQLNTSSGIPSNCVASSYSGDLKKLYFAQCGNGVWELSDELRAKKLSLKTSGASNGQTIVGAMSTGAHGSTVDVGGVQDYIVGMHIILSPDKHIWLERKSAPVISGDFIQMLHTELVQDDDLFNAALVSFGSFGIIHGVMIEADDLFLLECYLQRIPYDDKLKKIMETLDFSTAELPCGNERPFHFAVSINPYDLDKGAYVYTFYKRAYTDNYQRPAKNDAGIGPGDDAPVFIGNVLDIAPALVKITVNSLLGTKLKPYSKVMGTLGEIFSNTDFHGKLMSAAIGIPINQVNRVIEILLELNETDGPFPGLFATRYIKKSKATLAFTRFDFTCIVELDGVFSDTTSRFYTAVWKKLDDENIPYTAHWGKMNEMNPARIMKGYGPDVDTWITARNKLLNKDCLKVFTNPLLQEWGLDKVL